MKKYIYLLLIPALLTGCSEEVVIPPQNNPPLVVPQNIPPTIPSTEAPPTDLGEAPQPPEITSLTLSTETIHYLSECALLLDEFDLVYRSMEEHFNNTLEHREEDPHLTNYLEEVRSLVALLVNTEALTPTDQVYTEHQDFVDSSFALAEYLNILTLELEENDIPFEEKCLLLESTSSDLLPIIENFSNSAFVLMVGLGQNNLAG